MGQPASRGMCCSVREKEGRLLAAEPSGTAQFTYIEMELGLEKPRLLAFSPLWQHGSSGPAPRRLALAGERTVYVYRDDVDGRTDSEPGLVLEYSLQFSARRVVTGLLFRDEDTSRHLVVAISPTPGLGVLLDESASQHCVRIWGLSERHDSQQTDPIALNPDEGFVASLDQHGASVTRIAVSSTFLFTADTLGECRVWQKNRGYANKAAAQLHQGGGIDLTVDRLFVYSAGLQDNTIRVWSVPDLKPVLSIAAELPQELSASILNSRAGFEGAKEQAAAPVRCPLTALTALRRPVSRWSGSQGSMRSQHMPKGVLYVAGVISTGPPGTAGRGAGVLMEWSLGQVATCRSAQIAHDLPVVALAYGPYDNGPLTTADAHGVFRIWDVTPKLRCSQRVDVGLLGGDPTGLAIVVDPLRRGLFTITGGRRLLLWKEARTAATDPVGAAADNASGGGSSCSAPSGGQAALGGGGKEASAAAVAKAAGDATATAARGQEPRPKSLATSGNAAGRTGTSGSSSAASKSVAAPSTSNSATARNSGEVVGSASGRDSSGGASITAAEIGRANPKVLSKSVAKTACPKSPSQKS
eukprot:TRINITY_DN27720_c0_g1_i2.p1 TRINITY_DN27720_c0_g1~~TRINITY_DN27720_c0_g1_i2.p1  ORF type:complete len:585 (-),score=94.41 TRINITY_DN27720_c0_g1_i2:151-1905(-)